VQNQRAPYCANNEVSTAVDHSSVHEWHLIGNGWNLAVLSDVNVAKLAVAKTDQSDVSFPSSDAQSYELIGTAASSREIGIGMTISAISVRIA
jgi:hypothetical protein